MLKELICIIRERKNCFYVKELAAKCAFGVKGSNIYRIHFFGEICYYQITAVNLPTKIILGKKFQRLL